MTQTFDLEKVLDIFDCLSIPHNVIPRYYTEEMDLSPEQTVAGFNTHFLKDPRGYTMLLITGTYTDSRGRSIGGSLKERDGIKIQVTVDYATPFGLKNRSRAINPDDFLDVERAFLDSERPSTSVFHGVFNNPSWEMIAVQIVQNSQQAGRWIPYTRTEAEQEIREMLDQGLLKPGIDGYHLTAFAMDQILENHSTEPLVVDTDIRPRDILSAPFARGYNIFGEVSHNIIIGEIVAYSQVIGKWMPYKNKEDTDAREMARNGFLDPTGHAFLPSISTIQLLAEAYPAKKS